MLPCPVAIAEAKANHPGPGFLGDQAVRQVEHALDKAGQDADVGVEQQEPLAAAQPAALVDRVGEAAIAFPAPQGHAVPAAHAPGQGMRRRMVVDHHHLDLAPLRAGGRQQLAHEPGRFLPQAVIDDDDR